MFLYIMHIREPHRSVTATVLYVPIHSTDRLARLFRLFTESRIARQRYRVVCYGTGTTVVESLRLNAGEVRHRDRSACARLATFVAMIECEIVRDAILLLLGWVDTTRDFTWNFRVACRTYATVRLQCVRGPCQIYRPNTNRRSHEAAEGNVQEKTCAGVYMKLWI